MKKVLKSIFSFIGTIYLIFAVFAIICLLKTNEYGLPQFGNKTLVIINDDGMSNLFKKGDLILLTKPNNDDVKVNDAVFFYETEFKKHTINIGNIIKKEIINENEVTYHVNGASFSSSYLVGKVSGSVKYPVIGSILRVLTSKWGFMFLIIFPFFILFMVEVAAIYYELKYGKKNKKNS